MLRFLTAVFCVRAVPGDDGVTLAGSVSNTSGWVARYDAAVFDRSFLRRVAADDGVPWVRRWPLLPLGVSRFVTAAVSRIFYAGEQP